MQLRTRTRIRTNPILPLTLTLCISLGFGCGGVVYEGYDEDGERTTNIVNGQNDHGHPAVGVLYLKGQAGCTATLIGTRTVLTAAHCVTDSKSVPYQLFSNIGFALQPGGQVYSAEAVMVHQAYGSQNADVAVVRLSQPITSVTPMLIASKAPHVGETITLVGFGITADGASGTFGTKRRATNTIGKLTATEMIFYGAQGGVGNICNGDSGGPAFATRDGREQLVGVHSWGEGQCGVAEHDQRVDAYRSWIEQQAGNDLHKTPQPSTPPPPDPGSSPTPAPPVPKVSFSSPGANAQVPQSFSVTVQASCSDGIARVDLYVDGVKVQQKSAAPFTFQVSGLAAGHHNVRAEAVSKGQLKGSALISVQVQGSQQPAPPAPAPGAQPDPQTPSLPAPAPNASADEMAVVGACSLGGQRTAPPASLLLVALVWVLRRRRCRR